MRVKIAEYDPAWAKAFQTIRQSLATILTDVPVLSIEHVGSTAVPGLAAKPIIDIDIIVEPKHLPAACSALSFHGYTYNPEPKGIDRMSFRYNKHKHDSGAWTPTEDGNIRRAVYVNMPDGIALNNHLSVRAVLQTHPDLALEYSDVKRKLDGVEFDHIGSYVAAKNEVMQKILSMVDMRQDELDAIRHFNGLPKASKDTRIT